MEPRPNFKPIDGQIWVRRCDCGLTLVYQRLSPYGPSVPYEPRWTLQCLEGCHLSYAMRKGVAIARARYEGYQAKHRYAPDQVEDAPVDTDDPCRDPARVTPTLFTWWLPTTVVCDGCGARRRVTSFKRILQKKV